MAQDFDTLVIGAGVVGLACAAALAEKGQSVVVVEASEAPGTGNTSRNSEVIHAGLYYPTGSLKHRMCVAGRRMLYDFLRGAGIDYRKCGKLVVATSPDERDAIAGLHERALANGVEGVSLIEAGEVAAMEPALRAHAALWSPETGIFDSHAFLLALIARIEAAGGVVVCHAPVLRIARTGSGFRVHVGGADPSAVEVARLVNNGGLHAPAIAAGIDAMPRGHIPRQRLAKGSYFALTGRAPFSHLVYPAPADGGLGVHATLDLAGRVRFGPDVEWLPETTAPDSVDYTVSPDRAGTFETAVRRYWPGLPKGALVPDYAGCRPKLSNPGEPPADFVVQDAKTHGVDGLINLFGIESPGLTASLALAARVDNRLA